MTSDSRESTVNIPVQPKTKERLKRFGFFHETWDVVINRLLDEVEGKRANRLKGKIRVA